MIVITLEMLRISSLVEEGAGLMHIKKPLEKMIIIHQNDAPIKVWKSITGEDKYKRKCLYTVVDWRPLQ